MSSITVPRPDVTAWVESPFQLLGALEAHAAGLLGHALAVVPRAGVEPLADTVEELRRLGLPGGVRVLPAATAPPPAGRLAVGDAFSGQVQRLLVQRPPAQVVLLDDGRATRRMLDALVHPGVPLLRPHVPASRPRTLLAKAALARLQRRARHGWVDVVTALDLPRHDLDAARRAGLGVHRHDFGWLRTLPPAGDCDAPTVVLGTSMVANGIIAPEPYLEWVRSIATSGPVTYRAHRREDARTLDPLRAAGLDVRPGRLPVEVSLRGLTPEHAVVTLPTTAASTLRMLQPAVRIHEHEVPSTWWLPTVSADVRRLLVPDVPVLEAVA